MPRHDPMPRSCRADAEWARYAREMGWMAPAAALIAGLSVLRLSGEGGPLPVPAVVAILVGAGLAVLAGTALVGRLLLSSRTGHDDAAGRGDES